MSIELGLVEILYFKNLRQPVKRTKNNKIDMLKKKTASDEILKTIKGRKNLTTKNRNEQG